MLTLFPRIRANPLPPPPPAPETPLVPVETETSAGIELAEGAPVAAATVEQVVALHVENSEIASGSPVETAAEPVESEKAGSEAATASESVAGEQQAARGEEFAILMENLARDVKSAEALARGDDSDEAMPEVLAEIPLIGQAHSANVESPTTADDEKTTAQVAGAPVDATVDTTDAIVEVTAQPPTEASEAEAEATLEQSSAEAESEVATEVDVEVATDEAPKETAEAAPAEAEKIPEAAEAESASGPVLEGQQAEGHEADLHSEGERSTEEGADEEKTVEVEALDIGEWEEATELSEAPTDNAVVEAEEIPELVAEAAASTTDSDSIVGEVVAPEEASEVSSTEASAPAETEEVEPAVAATEADTEEVVPHVIAGETLLEAFSSAFEAAREIKISPELAGQDARAEESTSAETQPIEAVPQATSEGDVTGDIDPAVAALSEAIEEVIAPVDSAAEISDDGVTAVPETAERFEAPAQNLTERRDGGVDPALRHAFLLRDTPKGPKPGFFTLPRVPEPEAMDDGEEVEAYASATAQSHLDAIDDTFVAHAQLLLRGRERGRALDIGTGPGQIAIKLGYRLTRWKFVGVDRSPAMIEKAKEGLESAPELAGRVEFLVADGNNLDFPDQSFDLVYCNSVLHHLADPQKLFAEMARLVKPGGAVLLRDLRRPSKLALKGHIRKHGKHYEGEMKRLYVASVRAAYTEEELQQLIAASALRGVKVFRHRDTHIGFSRAAERPASKSL